MVLRVLLKMAEILKYRVNLFFIQFLFQSTDSLFKSSNSEIT
jgi:hypothetical protein